MTRLGPCGSDPRPTNAGENWTDLSQRVSGGLSSVSLGPEGEGVAVGSTVLRTTDAGATSTHREQRMIFLECHSSANATGGLWERTGPSFIPAMEE